MVITVSRILQYITSNRGYITTSILREDPVTINTVNCQKTTSLIIDYIHISHSPLQRNKDRYIFNELK